LKDSLTPGDVAYIGGDLTQPQLIQLAIGGSVSFVVAWAVIAWFMNWVRRRGFVPFAVYRIIIGFVVLAVAWRARA
jgi:undecaprenyl pyrophosphate phosphatase UppP